MIELEKNKRGVIELIVVLCKESKSPSHEVCDRCPVHRAHTEIPVALVCLDPSEDTAQQLKAALEKKFKEEGIVFDTRPIRLWGGRYGTPFLSREGELKRSLKKGEKRGLPQEIVFRNSKTWCQLPKKQGS